MMGTIVSDFAFLKQPLGCGLFHKNSAHKTLYIKIFYTRRMNESFIWIAHKKKCHNTILYVCVIFLDL